MIVSFYRRALRIKTFKKKTKKLRTRTTPAKAIDLSVVRKRKKKWFFYNQKQHLQNSASII